MILAASMGPTPKISMRVVAEASTSDSMRSFRSTIFRFSVRILGAGAPKLVGGGRARRSPALVCRAGCARPDRPRAFQLSRRGGGLVEARAGCLERSGALGHQVFAPTAESRRRTSEAASGSTAASRSLPEAASAVARASSPSFLRALPLDSTKSPLPRVWAARQPRTRLSPSTSPSGTDRGRQRSPAPNGARGTASLKALEGSQAEAVLREASTLEELA
jgi:hypothetical protein